MARTPAKPGFTPGGSGGRGSGRRFAYFRGVWEELRKVIWPTWPELSRMTGVVVVTVILFSLLIGGADLLLGSAVKQIYSNSMTTTGSTSTSAATPASAATATPSAAISSASPSASATS